MRETPADAPSLDVADECRWLEEHGVIQEREVEQDPDKNYGPLFFVESNPPADKVDFVLDAFRLRRAMPIEQVPEPALNMASLNDF